MMIRIVMTDAVGTVHDFGTVEWGSAVAETLDYSDPALIVMEEMPIGTDVFTRISDAIDARTRTRVQVGDMITGRAVNGHLMVYRVTGFYSDGMPQTSQWDATHSDKCNCDDPEW